MSGRRIWIAANQGEVGGGEVMLHHLATALRELGRDVAVVAPAEPSAVADRLEADGFPVARVGGPGRLGYMRALRRWHASHREAVLWCNGLLPATALAGRARRIVHLHQVPHTPQTRAFTLAALPGAAAVLAPSRFAAERIRGARVLPNWVPGSAGASAPRPHAADEPLRVGFLGRLSEDKGVLTLLEAAAALRVSDPGRFAFRVAGEARFVGEDEAARLDAALAAAGDDVAVLGWQDTADFLASIDVLAVPSHVPESFGLVAAEAMAAGVPVVVSEAGALPEVVGEGHPWVVPVGDAAALTAALRRVAAADPAHLAATVAEQRLRWERTFSPEAGRAAVAAVLRDLDI